MQVEAAAETETEAAKEEAAAAPEEAAAAPEEAESADAIKPEAVEKMKVSELREALAARGLESTGLKKELVERLQKALGA